jgi:serine/threonine protein kinase
VDVRFRRLIELVGEALQRSPGDRPAFLRDQCAGDSELLAEATALLEQEGNGSAGDFTARLHAHVRSAAARTLDDEPASSRIGELVGPYRLVGEIGHGGMGTVYAAERADDAYRARVAVKVVRGRLAAPELTRRFRAERQILADLDHPNIARLIDGGAMADGTPYLVMDFIEGERIDLWCDARDLGVRARVELFLQVCDAVAYAHRSGIIHRDLKPSNILVTGGGVPKLVDFGIAKLVTAGGEPEQTATLRVMTPTYASPEQVRGTPTTAATDIYSLGVVLYELLAGRPPFDLSNASAAEIERQICHARPAPPSAAFRDGPVTRAAPSPTRRSGMASATRGTAWRRELVGALDEIVLRSLHKDPGRRQPSVDALAQALRDYLREPSRGRLAARARRFARQPVTIVSAGAFVVVATSAGILARTGMTARVPPLGDFEVLPIPGADSGFPTPYRVHTADLNGDGRADIVWNHLGATSSRARVGLSEGDGRFSLAPAFAHPEMPAPGADEFYELVVGDFTGDGQADLAWHLRAHVDKRLYVALSNGDGSFRFLEPQPVPHTWFQLWRGYAADTDGDRLDDIFFNILGDENVLRAFRSRGDGTFEQAQWSIHPARYWSRYHAFIADVDGDRRPDLIWNDVPGGINRLYVARSLDSLQMQPWQDHPLAVQEDVPPERSRWAGYTTHVADIDGDARADVVWIDAGGDSLTIHRALGQPTAQFRYLDAQTIPRPAGAGPLATVTGDFNGDARADILMYDPAGDRCWIALGTPAGDFVPHPRSFQYRRAGGAGGPNTSAQGGVAVADLDGDGRTDIIWYGPSGTYVMVTRRPGTGP